MSNLSQQQSVPRDTGLAKDEFFAQALRRGRHYVRRATTPIHDYLWRRILASITAVAERHGSDFFVLQIGANDGIHSDPIRQFIQKYSWRGTLVEPVPHHFENLKQNYRTSSGLSFVKAAIADVDGEVTIYAAAPLPNGDDNPLLGKDSLHYNLIEERAWMSDLPLEQLIVPIKVPSMRLQTLLNTQHIKSFDMFVVDAEGCDKLILDQLDLNRYKPVLILYEHLNLSRQDRSALAKRLKKYGYTLKSWRRDTLAELKG
jgi:FkbM family methyltransferase